MPGPHDGRYAPSPTGQLHLGNLRTALAAWLFARAGGGSFLLRVDDLDPDRSRPEHEAAQLRDLRRLGLDWDGAPVRQSARLDRYAEALVRLEGDGWAYPCFCSRAEVRAAASAPHGATPGDAYAGTCAGLAPAAGAARAAAEPHCLRVRAGGVEVGYEDGVLGRVAGTVDDFVVRRRDGVPAYNLASVVDDSDLAVHEVVRGADLAETTPRQLWLADVLGLDAPRFCHIPLVLGPDGARLSKRHGAPGLLDLAVLGLEPARVRGILARTLGLGTGNPEPTPGELLEAFDARRIPPTAVRLDPARVGAAVGGSSVKPLDGPEG